MKVIELLNRIANREEVPTRIRYRNEIYKAEYNRDFEQNYYQAEDENINVLLLNEISSVSQLNDEVEIIEEEQEDKKIQRLNQDNFQCVSNLEVSGQSANYFEYGLEDEIMDIVDKINEIIDKINKGEE